MLRRQQPSFQAHCCWCRAFIRLSCESSRLFYCFIVSDKSDDGCFVLVELQYNVACHAKRSVVVCSFRVVNVELFEYVDFNRKLFVMLNEWLERAI